MTLMPSIRYDVAVGLQSLNKDKKEKKMNNYEFVAWFMTLSWGGPNGLAIFLAGLGIYYWGRSLFDKAKKDNKS